MAIHFEFERKAAYLQVRTWGSDEDLEEAMAYGVAVLREATKSGAKRVLCDERELVYALGTVDIYQLAKAAAFAPALSKVAVVTGPLQTQDLDFWTTVATHRGLRARAFAALKPAEDWLSSDE
jgi:hypothetical protein